MPRQKKTSLFWNIKFYILKRSEKKVSWWGIKLKWELQSSVLRFSLVATKWFFCLSGFQNTLTNDKRNILYVLPFSYSKYHLKKGSYWRIEQDEHLSRSYMSLNNSISFCVWKLLASQNTGSRKSEKQNYLNKITKRVLSQNTKQAHTIGKSSKC